MPGVTINIEAHGPVVVMSEGATFNNNQNVTSSTGRAQHAQQAIPSSSNPRATSTLPTPAQQPYAGPPRSQAPQVSPRAATSTRTPPQNTTGAAPSSALGQQPPGGRCQCSRCQQQQQQQQQQPKCRCSRCQPPPPPQQQAQQKCQCSRCQPQLQEHRHAHAHAHAHRHEHHHTVRVEHVSGSRGPSQQGYQASKHASAFSVEDDRLERNKRRRYD